MEHKDFTPQVREAQASFPVHKNEKPYALYDRYDYGTDFGTLIATEDKAKIVGQALNAFNRMDSYMSMTAAITATAMQVENETFWPKWQDIHDGAGTGTEYYAVITKFAIICTEMWFAAQAAFPEGFSGVWDYEVAEEFGSDLRQSIEQDIYDELLLKKAMFADAINFIESATGETCPEPLNKEFRRIASI